MIGSYVIRAATGHAERLVAKGLADGRPLRVDGFSLDEGGAIRRALLAVHRAWRVQVLAKDNDEATGGVNAERATRYRNEAAGHPEAPFVLLVPLGVTVESSLNEPAFYVISRATIFGQALSELRSSLRISAADVQALRETAQHHQAEAVYAFLGAWDPLTGVIEADAALDHLGLLADSTLDGRSITAIKAGLRRNSEAMEVLLRPGVSPQRMVGELVQRLGVDPSQYDDLVALRSWLSGGRRGRQPRLADIGTWEFGAALQDPPEITLVADLARSPHVGWADSEVAPIATDPRGRAKLVWAIKNRAPLVRTEIDLVEEVSQSVIRSFGKSQGLSKTISWPHVFGVADMEATLRELNPGGDVDGYLFRFRLRLMDGRTFLQEIETDPFQVAVDAFPSPVDTIAAAQTAWHALYRFHSERAVSPRIDGVSSEDPALVTLQEDAGARRRVIRVDLSPALVAAEERLLDQPDFAGSWKLHLTPGLVSAPAGIDPRRLVLGTADGDFLAARREFFRAVRGVGLVETLDFSDSALRKAALAYVEAWNGLTERFARAAYGRQGLADQVRLDAARLGSIDTLQLVFQGEFEGDLHEVLVVAPTHPTVVAWALDFHDLVHEWSRGPYDTATKPPYRAGPAGSAVLGGVEGFHAGPRSMVTFTAFENETTPTGWAYSGSVHALWQCFVRASKDVGSRSREWPEALQRLLGLSTVPAGGNRIDARRVGSRLKKYAILHPYVRQLKVTGLLAGDGLPMLDALRVIDERPGTPAGAQSIRELRYELQVVGPRSDRLGSAVEDLTANPGDGRWRGYASTVLDNPESVLSPGFAFGIHGLDPRPDATPGFWPSVSRVLEEMPGGSNVTVFGPLLGTGTRAVPSPEAPAGYGARGLVSRPATVVSEAGGGQAYAGNWTLVIPRPDRNASTAASGQHALLTILDLAGGPTPVGHQVGLDVSLSGPVSQALEVAHQTSDWVVIADPLFSIELMDKAEANPGSLLLDYSPEFDPYPGGRVVVSTSTLGELTKLGAANPDVGLASAALMRVLSSISARLLLSLANPTKQTVRGLHGLALTRVFFRAHYPNALVIPMDGHADMFAVPRVSGTSRLADLLAVSIIDGRLHLAVVESKWVGKANLAAKAKDGALQAQTSMEVLKAEFIEYAGVDRALRIDALREIILFHLARAKRHQLPSPFTREALLEATASHEAVCSATIDGHVVVWCPDSDVQLAPAGSDVALIQMGDMEIRRYATAMDGWPDAQLVDDAEAEETQLSAIFEELIGSTLEDDLAEREAREIAEEAAPSESVDASAVPGPDESASPVGADVTNWPPRAEDEEPVVASPDAEPAEPEPIATVPPGAVRSAVDPAGPPPVRAPGRSIAINLGRRVRTDEPVGWAPAELANGHVAVLGGSGAGKTTLLRKLARCLTRQGLPVLVLDFHGDLTLPAGEYSYDFAYDGNASFVNPLHLDPAYAEVISPSRIKWEFLEAWRSQYPSLGIQQRNYLTTLVEEAYLRAGITKDPQTWGKQIDFSHVLAAFDASTVGDAQKLRIDAYMKQYREWSVFHGGTPISMESMLQRSTRLNLSQLDEGARNIVADVVLRRLFLLAKAMGPLPSSAAGWERFRIYVVIDEAQVLLKSDAEAKASLAKYASEARKFGIGLILATQLRDSIPGDVWGNIDTRLWMLALDQAERQKNAKAANLPEQSIGSLKVGEAFLVASSQPGSRPIHLKIDPESC